MTTFVPRNAEEVADTIRWALAAREAFEVIAGGSKSSLGRPVDAPHRLDVSALAGVVSYEPDELVLTARPGTPTEIVEALLAERAQCLAFEPPNLAPLLRGSASAHGDVAGDDGHMDARRGGTLGGVVSTGFSGPRRLRAGAVRDHLLGIAAVSGRGETFVGGGKVVKNVTGYDIPKLMTGSHGTLAVLTEITLKVLPAPEDVRTLLVHGLAASDAVRVMTGVLQSDVDVSGACYFPADLAVPGTLSGDSRTALRLEGFLPSVEYRLVRLREKLERQASLSVLDHATSLTFWRGVRDVRPFTDNASRMVWRLSVPPAEGAAVLERIAHAIPGTQSFLDWGGGLLWSQLPDDAGAHDSRARTIRSAIGDAGGHAMLIRAPEHVRAGTDVFHPQSEGVAALSRRVKAQFDPSHLLNPGRMVAGV